MLHFCRCPLQTLAGAESDYKHRLDQEPTAYYRKIYVATDDCRFRDNILVIRDDNCVDKSLRVMTWGNNNNIRGINAGFSSLLVNSLLRKVISTSDRWLHTPLCQHVS